MEPYWLTGKAKAMAKITANGATEVAKIATLGPGGARYFWVINSKGVILRRATGPFGSGYTVYSRKNTPTRATLIAVIRRAGHQEA